MATPPEVTRPRRQLKFCVDFEATGQHWMRILGGSELNLDVVFAYAIVVAWWNEAEYKMEILDRRSCVVNLGKPDGLPWEPFWLAAGFEPRAFVKFWKDNLEALDSMMAEARSRPPVYSIETQFVRDREELEEKFKEDEIHYCTDSHPFDTVIASYMMQMAHGNSLLYFAKPGDDGMARYNPADPIDLTSLIIGKRNLPFGGYDYEKEYEPISKLLNEIADTYAPHDHTPLNDAINMACKLIYVEQSLNCDPSILRMHLWMRQRQLQTAQ